MCVNANAWRFVQSDGARLEVLSYSDFPANRLALEEGPSSFRPSEFAGALSPSVVSSRGQQDATMPRANLRIGAEGGLYERDFCLWVEEQVRLLRAGELERLDVTNLVEEIQGLGIGEKNSVQSNLVVVLKHLLKYRYQPDRRSRSWLSSIAEHRRRLRNDLKTSPSLRPFARSEFKECYRDARRQALIETGLPPDATPSTPPYTLEQTLDPDFLPE